jgi:hypothetical protein
VGKERGETEMKETKEENKLERRYPFPMRKASVCKNLPPKRIYRFEELYLSNLLGQEYPLLELPVTQNCLEPKVPLL